jgi:hypothetical protein
MSIDNIFGEISLDTNKIICHSGGADGSDTEWSNACKELGIKTNAYSYKTKYHNSEDKIEISEEDFQEGIREVHRANKYLKRHGISKYINLLARNWAQVKYSTQVFAIGTINESQLVNGGTGWAVMMAILNEREVFVFEQDKNKWFIWSDAQNKFIEYDTPKISSYNFAGIGTREINSNGVKAIHDVVNLLRT